MPKAPMIFWIDFIIYPVLGLSLLITYCRDAKFALLAGFGVLLFTFIEYWAHRLALHGAFYHGDHEHHHKHPADYIVFPIWFVPLVYFGFYVILPLSIFTGVVLGLVWFIYWHHILHHIKLATWPRFVQKYATWHLLHHSDETCNYGITVPFWDWLFRTTRSVS